MNLLDTFRHEHQQLRERLTRLEEALAQDETTFPAVFFAFQADASAHMKRKDLFYKQLDENHRVPDRVLMHDLRNNHAAVVFALESLGIRLRKNGPNAEWRLRWTSMTNVLKPHWDQEERDLFPLFESLLSAEEQQRLTRDIEALR